MSFKVSSLKKLFLPQRSLVMYCYCSSLCFMLIRWRHFELVYFFSFKLEEPPQEGSLQIKDGCPGQQSQPEGLPFLLKPWQ